MTTNRYVNFSFKYKVFRKESQPGIVEIRGVLSCEFICFL